MDDFPSGAFELVLGISSRNLDLKAIDSITFDHVYCDTTTTRTSNYPSEVPTKQEEFYSQLFFSCLYFSNAYSPPTHTIN